MLFTVTQSSLTEVSINQRFRLAQQLLASSMVTCAVPLLVLPHCDRYTLHPSGMSEFLKLAGETAQVRAKLLPFLG